MRVDPARLESALNELGVVFKPTAQRFVMDCPRCGGQKKLSIYRESGWFACWVCRGSAGDRGGFSGAPEFALRELTGRSIGDIRALLYGVREASAKVPLAVHFDAFAEEDEDDAPPPPENEMPDLVWPVHVQPIDARASRPGREYLEGRGIPADLALQYDVHYDVDKRALAFPCWVGGRLVGWQTRIIDPVIVECPDGTVIKQLKAVSTSAMPRDRVVMFAHRLEKCDHAVVCEGPIDALHAHLAGGNVATAGKAVAPGQCEALMMAGVRKIYLALDPDAAFEIAALERRLGIDDVELHRVQIPDQYEDLGAMPLEEARDAILSSPILPKGLMHLHFRAKDLVL
jgi:hypothetical protein